MQGSVLRKLFLGFIQVHILYHAKKEPFYGSWMIDELKRHGYEISAGTLYPMLHNLQEMELLSVKSKTENGKVRKYYAITKQGAMVLKEAKKRVSELAGELD